MLRLKKTGNGVGRRNSSTESEAFTVQWPAIQVQSRSAEVPAAAGNSAADSAAAEIPTQIPAATEQRQATPSPPAQVARSLAGDFSAAAATTAAPENPSDTPCGSSGPVGPQGKRSLDNILDDCSEVELEYSGLCLLGLEEPVSYSEALKEHCWLKAMKEEMSSIKGNKTWELCDLPKGQKSIGLKWVYKLKKDSTGAVVRHKARLVAKGYVQRQGIDFDEVYAPVARIESVRLMIALAAQEGWKLHSHGCQVSISQWGII